MSTAQALPKGGTSRFNLSTQSLDMVISTFQVQDRGTQQAPILGLWGANGVGSLPGDSPFGPATTGLSATASAAAVPVPPGPRRAARCGEVGRTGAGWGGRMRAGPAPSLAAILKC